MDGGYFLKKMYPEICKLGPFTIYSYGLMLVLAFMVAAALSSSRARKENFNPDIIFNLLFISFVSGVIGARVFYVIEHIGDYIRSPLEVIMFQHGGLSWFGGLILGSVSGIIFLKNKKLEIYKALDLIAPFLALAQAIGRVGCLLNACCLGKESTFGIYFTLHGRILIPVQAYSSVLLIFIFMILRFLQDRPHKAGYIFFMYLLLYSLKRFFIEFLRADNEIVLFGLTLFQVISIAIFIFSIYKLLVIAKIKRIQ